MEKNLLFGTITLILILLIFFFGSKVVSGQYDTDRLAKESWYDYLESSYLKEIKMVLEEKGFENSGVNLTKIVEDEVRQYAVLIYNQRFEMTQEVYQLDLLNALKGISFDDSYCEFQIALGF